MDSCTLAILVSSLIVYVSSHGAMVNPINWFDQKKWYPTKAGMKYYYFGMKSGLQCSPGFGITADEICTDPDECIDEKYPGVVCMWYKNGTQVEKPTIFDTKLLTYPVVDNPKYYEHHPWRAPGYAPIDGPCGVAGGNLHGCKGGKCKHKAGGYGYGIKATDYNFKYEIKVTNWTSGGIAEVAWGITANHGGGYSYRLCKLPSLGFRGLTEECFQNTPLRFHGENQWVQYGEDPKTRIEFPAVRVNKGTFPEGSEWTKNPIPACIGYAGGFFLNSTTCPFGTQFPPPGPGLSGFGANIYRTVKPFQFSIIDLVEIPEELPLGNYVLSFRWDCEQTPQVWNTCASIFIN